MNPVRAALTAHLKADATLIGLLGPPAPGRSAAVYHRKAPQGATHPYVIFNRQSPRDEWTFEDFTSWDLWLVKGVCRGGDAEEAEDIDARCKLVLNDAELTIAGFRQLVLRREGIGVDYGELDAGGEQIHHVGGLYRLVTQPT